MSQYFDATLIEKYSISGPRYTSYPTAVQFHDGFTDDSYRKYLQSSNISKHPLSLYIHIPFCESVCFYCACNKIITRNHKQAAQYLDYLERDIAMQAQYIDPKRKVVQLHFGGGTPTFLRQDEQTKLLNILKSHFYFASDQEGEFSIEIDPRTVDEQYLIHLRKLGFNRISFGIQDFDPEVQKSINRIQPLTNVKQIFNHSRALGYHSISVDLIYGLPSQTTAKFATTIDEVIRLSPDRIAVFNYAHLPSLFGAQKQMNASDMPDSATKLDILKMTITKLTDAGYEFIGLDHFAKHDDSLVQHQKNGTLYRNFQGYSTFSNCDLLGFGISAISMVGNSYSQHQKARTKYYQAIDSGHMPVLRGISLGKDDLVRRYVITEIMCNLALDLEAVSAKFSINAQDYFAREWQKLIPMAADNLLTLDATKLQVKPLGRLLIRNIAMVFDAYLGRTTAKQFSKVI